MKIPSLKTFFTKPLYAAGLAAFITLIVKFFNNRNKTMYDPDYKPMAEYLKSMAYSAVLVGAFVFLSNKMSGGSSSDDFGGSGFASASQDRFPSEPRYAPAPIQPQPTSFGATRFDRARPSAVPYNRGFQ